MKSAYFIEESIFFDTIFLAVLTKREVIEMPMPEGVLLIKVMRKEGVVRRRAINLPEALKLLAEEGEAIQMQLTNRCDDCYAHVERADKRVWGVSVIPGGKDCYLPKSPSGALDRAYRMLIEKRDGVDPGYSETRFKP